MAPSQTIRLLVSLLGGLLLVVLVLLGTGRSGQGALENLEDLLILDLLVRLELRKIGGGRGSKPGDAVLGDG